MSGHILYTSESLASLLGYLPASLHNTTIYEIVADGDKIPLYNTLNISHGTAEYSDQHQVHTTHPVTLSTMTLWRSEVGLVLLYYLLSCM